MKMPKTQREWIATGIQLAAIVALLFPLSYFLFRIVLYSQGVFDIPPAGGRFPD